MTYKSIIIIGPGLEYSTNIIKGLNLKDCVVIGDGKRDITDKDWADLKGKIDSDTHIHLHAHGSNTLPGFTMQYTKEKSYEVEYVFRKLTEASGNKPLQVALHACFSGAAAKSVTSLPNGSILAMHAPKDSIVIASACANIIQNYTISAQSSEYSKQLNQLFLDNIATNLSGRGAGIAANQHGVCKSVALELNVKAFEMGIPQYITSSAVQVEDFYNKRNAEFERYSKYLGVHETANKFFQKESQIPSLSAYSTDDLLTAAFVGSAGSSDSESLEYLSSKIKPSTQYGGLSALAIAASTGHIKNAKLLIDKGVNVNAESREQPPLYNAIYYGEREMVELLLEHGAKINAIASNGVTPLMQAILSKRTEMVKLLIQKGADPNLKSTHGNTPLGRAVYEEDLYMVKILLDNGASIYEKNEGGSTVDLAIEKGNDKILLLLFHHAITLGDIEMFKVLMPKVVDINANSDWPFKTSLMLAIEKGEIDMIKLLLEKDADVNTHYFGVTTLTIAVEKGNTEIVRMLLEKGVNIHDKTCYKDPLLEAVKLGNSAIVKLLLDNGADPNINRFGATTLTIAIKNGNTEIIKLLLEKGVNPAEYQTDFLNLHGLAVDKGDIALSKMVLQFAVSQGDPEVVKHMLTHADNIGRQDLNIDILKAAIAQDNQEVTLSILNHAVSLGDIEFVKFMLEGGVDVNWYNIVTPEALVMASAYGQTSIVEFLIEKGALVNRPDEGSPALFAAIQSNKIDIVNILIDKGAKVGEDIEGITPYSFAILRGATEIAEVIHGAVVKNETHSERSQTDVGSMPHDIAPELNKIVTTLNTDHSD